MKTRFLKGDKVRLKIPFARKSFPNLEGKVGEVTSVALMPNAFRVRFENRRTDTWHPDLFVKV